MPGHALVATVGAARDTLQAALEAFDGPPAASEALCSKHDLVVAAERVKGDAAKVGVMCGGGGDSGGGSSAGALAPDVAASMIGALQQSCLEFCARCYAVAGPGAGASLRKDARALAAGVVDPALGLLRALESGDDLKRAIGLVWQGCDAVPRAGLDNKAALFKGLAGVMAVLKDTLREMEELQEEGESSSGSGSDGEDAGATAATKRVNAQGQRQQQQQEEEPSGAEDQRNLRELADLDFDPGTLDAPERNLLASCLQLMEAVAAVVKAFGRALLQGPPLARGQGGPGGSEALDAWESTLFHARNLQRCVEDLGAAMYPPQDLDEVRSAAEAAATTAELMLDECPAPDALGQDLGRLGDALQAAAARVERVLAAGSAENGAADD